VKGESVIGVIFDKEKEKVLLIKRMDVPVFVLPGGGIEADESPEEAMCREIKEETGLEVKIIRKIGEYSPQNRLTRFTHLFECDPIGGDLKTGQETKELNFYPLHALPKLIPPPFRRWIFDATTCHSFIRKPIEGATYLDLIRSIIFHPILVLRFFLSKWGMPLNR